MFNVEWFDKVPISKDGNCMFRAITACVNEELTNCRRKRNGVPVNKDNSDLEDELSTSLRKIVVTHMNIHKNKFNNPLQYDNEIYESIEERIENMYNDGEFGGELELYIISKIFKIQINVFVKGYGGYNLVSKIGKDSSHICNLFYESNHYELMVLRTDFNKNYKRMVKQWCKENPQIDFEDFVSSEHSDSDYEII